MKNPTSKSTSKKGILKMAGIILGAVFGSIVALCLIALLIVWSWSPGEAEPYYNNGEVQTGSISEIIRMEIGGVEQGMIIRGKDANNPVLLFLHGGPGNPEYVIAKQYNIGLEDYFTVCWWDQRGSGMSYSSTLDPESVTTEQMVSDTVDITNYLRDRFGKDRIYLMGHSWGSFLGTNTIYQYPELFEAYIGIGQISNGLESEKLGYESMMSTAKKSGDTKSIKKLQKHKIANTDAITKEYLMLRSGIMNKQGNGVFHAPYSMFNDVLMPLLQFREYTLSDKYGYMAGALFAFKCPANDAGFTTNLMETITEVDIPVYIFHGVYDRQVSYELSEQYFDMLEAPEKKFYSFENSAHSPFMEEPQRFIQIIRDEILAIEK